MQCHKTASDRLEIVIRMKNYESNHADFMKKIVRSWFSRNFPLWFSWSLKWGKFRPIFIGFSRSLSSIPFSTFFRPLSFVFGIIYCASDFHWSWKFRQLSKTIRKLPELGPINRNWVVANWNIVSACNWIKPHLRTCVGVTDGAFIWIHHFHI